MENRGMNAMTRAALLQAVSEFIPPVLLPAVVAVMNRAARRAPASIGVGGRTVTLRLRPPSAFAADFCLEWMFGDERQRVFLPRRLADALELPIPDPEGGADGAALAAMVLECMLTRPIERIEALADCPIVLQRLDVAPPDAALGLSDAVLLLEVEHDRAKFGVGLDLGPAALATLAALLDRMPVMRAESGAIPLQICLRAGITELTLSDLRALRAGDAVLLQETGLMDGRVAMIVGERRMAAARLSPDGAVLETTLRPAAGTPVGRWCVDNQFEDPVDDDVREMRVTLVFEMGRRLASLAEVEGLGVGSVVDTGAGPDGLVDVLVNGRRIGRGRIVQVGGSLAVQLERINHGTDP